MEKLLTIEDIMEIFSVSRVTVISWINRGILKAYKPTKRTIRFKEKDVLLFLQSGSPLMDKR